MKKILLLVALLRVLSTSISYSQNTFPSSGNTGIGTLTPATTLQVKGTTRLGGTSNYAKFDTTGSLSFTGTAQYKVGGNQYAFSYGGNTNYGLYFNLTNTRYEFRDGTAAAAMYVNANTGIGYFKGGLQIGNIATGAVAGNLRWSGSDFQGYNGTSWLSFTNPYTPGTGISIVSGVIALTNSGVTVSTYGSATQVPQFTVDATGRLISASNVTISGVAPGGAAGGDLTGSYPSPSIAISAVSYAKMQNETNSTLLGNPTGSAAAPSEISLGTGLGFSGTTLFVKGGGNNWSTTGNSGTSVGTNFIGTTDNQPLEFKVDGFISGYIDNAANPGNTGFGYQTLKSVNVGGTQNSALGYQALVSNTGDNNTATGYESLFANTSGTDNVANGVNALFTNTTGSFNTASGNYTLISNTTGFENTADGASALYENTTGFDNTAIGLVALHYNTTGSNNTAVGVYALYLNSTGYSNVAVGVSTLINNTTAHNIVALGDSALYSNTNGSANTALGSKALYSNTADNNTATGYLALYSNTTGTANEANGNDALYSNTTGSTNTANGSQALISNTTGNANSAMGYSALNDNNTGYDNTASGAYALFDNNTGYENTASGTLSLVNNTTGANNTATGFYSLYSCSKGYSNSAFGASSMWNTTTAHNLVAMGDSSLFKNKTGSQNTALGSKALFNNTASTNTATGYQSLFANTTGANNTATGAGALNKNVKGSFNTAVGVNAINADTGGSNNVVVGYDALQSNVAGSYNTVVGSSAFSGVASGNKFSGFGYNTGLSAVTDTNSTALGYNANITAANQVRIGNSAVTSIGGFANWSNVSDGRFKNNIKENVPGLAFIKKLRPVTYNLDVTGINKFLNPQPVKDENGNIIPSPNDDQAIHAKEKIVYSGFIAQEVETTAKGIGYDFSGVDAPKNDKDLYGLRYSDFVVPLVKAVQELSSTNDSLKTQNQQLQTDNSALKNSVADLQTEMNDLKTEMEQIKAVQEQCCFNAGSSSTSSFTGTNNSSDQPGLQQNVPNPFNQTTTIHYYLPNNTQNAQILVTDQGGHLLKTFNLQGSGVGQVVINGGELAAGSYFYSLIINGNKIDTKQMVLTK